MIWGLLLKARTHQPNITSISNFNKTWGFSRWQIKTIHPAFARFRRLQTARRSDRIRNRPEAHAYDSGRGGRFVESKTGQVPGQGGTQTPTPLALIIWRGQTRIRTGQESGSHQFPLGLVRDLERAGFPHGAATGMPTIKTSTLGTMFPGALSTFRCFQHPSTQGSSNERRTKRTICAADKITYVARDHLV